MTGAALREEKIQNESSARGSSFYAAMRIMPPRERAAMHAIYHFCRSVDDIADDEGEADTRLGQLQKWREEIEALYEGNPLLTLGNLTQAIAGFGLRQEDFLAVIDGMEMDVRGPIRAPDMKTLELYCDRVACAVGRLSVRVFGLPEKAGRDLAHHQGMALQLTNILRDLDEDAAMGRLYLPAELLAQAGITSTDPVTVLADPGITDACNALAEKALGHFREAETIMKSCSRRSSRTPRIMAQAYRSIHAALVDRGFRSPRRPVTLSRWKLGCILMLNLF